MQVGATLKLTASPDAYAVFDNFTISGVLGAAVLNPTTIELTDDGYIVIVANFHYTTALPTATPVPTTTPEGLGWFTWANFTSADALMIYGFCLLTALPLAFVKVSKGGMPALFAGMLIAILLNIMFLEWPVYALALIVIGALVLVLARK